MARDAQGRTAHDVARGADAAGRGDSRTLLYGAGELADWLKPGGACETLAARAKATGAPVSDDDASVVFAAWACARHPVGVQAVARRPWADRRPRNGKVLTT